MNDRYLYKAKDTDDGEWAIGHIAISYSFAYIIAPLSDGNFKWFGVDKSTICQCTGLKDKNGKLIWENDIVKVGWRDNEAQSEEIQKVTWNKNGYYPWIDEFNCDGCDLFNEIMFVEVIGNIFDNPELLEV